jgi:hypothetical protein
MTANFNCNDWPKYIVYSTGLATLLELKSQIRGENREPKTILIHLFKLANKLHLLLILF